MKLYEMSEAYDRIRQLMDAGEDFAQAVEDIKDEASVKLLAIGRLIREREAEAKAISEEAKRLSAHAATRQNAADWLKTYAERNMVSLGLDKVQDAVVTLRMQNAPLAVDVTDESIIPSNFKRATLTLPLNQVPDDLAPLAKSTVDKAAILAVFKDGRSVPGAAVVQRKYLRLA